MSKIGRKIDLIVRKVESYMSKVGHKIASIANKADSIIPNVDSAIEVIEDILVAVLAVGIYVGAFLFLTLICLTFFVLILG